MNDCLNSVQKLAKAPKFGVPVARALLTKVVVHSAAAPLVMNEKTKATLFSSVL